MAQTTQAATPTPTLPTVGMSRFKQIQPFLPISREKFRQMVRALEAPQPVRFSTTCVMYKNEELHKFLADPLNYRAEVAA